MRESKQQCGSFTVIAENLEGLEFIVLDLNEKCYLAEWKQHVQLTSLNLRLKQQPLVWHFFFDIPEYNHILLL